MRLVEVEAADVLSGLPPSENVQGARRGPPLVHLLIEQKSGLVKNSFWPLPFLTRP